MVNSGVDDRSDENLAIYRCVCGENVEVRQQEVTCDACGRRYDRGFLDTAGADTVSIDADHLPARLITHPDHDPYIGQSLGHFKVLSRIGDGGMGAVYHALDESLQRYVALKVIHKGAGGAEGTADLDRLFQEARAQARVSHPHVVHVYYVGIENDTPFLAMELVGAGTLGDRMREGTLSFQETVRFAIQITRALGCAAEYDIVHGDIKPSNVLLVNDRTSKLSDFGLARRLSAPTESSSKMSGTPDYMPPESTLGDPVDHRGDMYALGVTLFQLTFGRLPYTVEEGCDLSDRLRLHREAEVEFPERWPAELPEAWRSILERLLDKDPAQRYESFVDLENALQRVKPVNVPIANPLLRGLAWILDSMLIAVAMIVLEVAAFSVDRTLYPQGTKPFGLVLPLGGLSSISFFAIAIGFLATMGLLQAHWGNTTGKRFLQILIVDQHGLKPRRRVLAARSAFQFSWAWAALFVYGPLAWLGVPGFSRMLGWLAAALLIAEAVSVLLRSGRSIHDSIFATRVVLDASPPATFPTSHRRFSEQAD